MKQFNKGKALAIASIISQIQAKPIDRSCLSYSSQTVGEDNGGEFFTNVGELIGADDQLSLFSFVTCTNVLGNMTGL